MISINKEQIKDRMVSMAARHWGVSENEVESNFDPLVTLLFDAIAAELEKIGLGIKEIQGSLLEEFSTVMMPLDLLKIQPAHCVISATPIDLECNIDAQNVFETQVYNSKRNNQKEQVNLEFMPVGDFKLLKTSIEFLKIGNNIYQYSNNAKKPITEIDRNGSVNSIQIALDNTSSLKDISGLQFYFDLKGHSEAENFYSALKNVSATVNGVEVDFKNGYNNEIQFESTLEEMLNQDFSYINKLQKSVASIYKQQMAVISNAPIEKSNEDEKTLFWNSGDEDVQKKNKELPLIYLTLHSKIPFSINALERLNIAVNAVPVINQTEERLIYKTEKWVNIIPLPVRANFLSLKNIESFDGGRYKYRLSKTDNELAEGEAILRSSRVGSSHSKDIRKTIENLLESIRNESAFFSGISNDFIAERLGDISKILTRLEDKMYLAKDAKAAHFYLLLKSHKSGSNVEVKYYVTDTENGMLVKIGSAFRSKNHTLTDNKNCLALTNSIGASAPINDFSAKQSLLRQLTSKGKIISIEDIRHLCWEIMGEHLLTIEVSKKMIVQSNLKSGLTRVTHILLGIKENAFTEEELYFFKQRILQELELSSTFIYPFEIEFRHIR